MANPWPTLIRLVYGAKKDILYVQSYSLLRDIMRITRATPTQILRTSPPPIYLYLWEKRKRNKEAKGFLFNTASTVIFLIAK